MRIAKLEEAKFKADTIDEFGGLNRGTRIAENEFSAMENMTGEDYPVLSTRAERGVVQSIYEFGTIFNADGELGWIDRDRRVRIGGTVVVDAAGNPMSTYVAAGQNAVVQNTVRFGANILFFPALMYLNLASKTYSTEGGYWYWEFGSLSGTDGQEIVHPPLMDVVTASGNRVWGARYGIGSSMTNVNEIYASKLGSMSDFRVGADAGDGYAVSISMPGYFTGACELNGHPVFFKENAVIVIYGTEPSNYSVSVIEGAGVRLGCARTVVPYNGAVYYRGPNAVCRFDGSAPVAISEKLGDLRSDYHAGTVICGELFDIFNAEGAAGIFDGKYYISMAFMEGASMASGLFVYDIRRGLWHKETTNNNLVWRFLPMNENLYFPVDSKVISVRREAGRSGADGDPVTFSWSCETGDIAFTDPQRRTVNHMDIAVIPLFENESSLVTATVSFYFRGVPADESVTYNNTVNRPYTIYIPVRPRRCDHFRVRLSGNRPMKIAAVTKYYEKGSNLH